MAEPAKQMTAAEAVAAPVCTEPDCSELAVSTYIWAWGERGACCARHQFLVGQRSKNLKRQVTFMAAGPAQPTPLTRDERVQLHAARLTAEDETIEAKARTAKLYSQNQALAAELATVTRRKEALEREMALQSDATRHLADQYDATLKELDTARDEVVRLQTLMDALQGAQVARLPQEG